MMMRRRRRRNDDDADAAAADDVRGGRAGPNSWYIKGWSTTTGDLS